MLERFYDLKKEIKMAMVQLDVPYDLFEKEVKEINEMCEALAPSKAAVDALASKDADMLLSEKIIAFVLKKLGELQSNNSKELVERFSIRVDERRNDQLYIFLNTVEPRSTSASLYEKFALRATIRKNFVSYDE